MTSAPERPAVSADEDFATGVVRRFYDYVDSGDVAALAALFAPDAEYVRPGYGVMTGPEGLTRFYGTERVIRSGKHELTTVVSDGHTVGVFGGFRGELHDDSPVEMRFADSFTVRPDGLFSSRATYFFAPLH